MTTNQHYPVAAPDFDALYADNPDPWQVETSHYEQRKLAVLLASLPRERYSSIWEPGCGPGIVAQMLRERTDRLVATDSSAIAIQQARTRCGDLPELTFEVSALPADPFEGKVELVVVAEFLYYIEDFKAVLDTVWRHVEPGGQAVFLHWVHHPHDAYRSGRSMHADIAIDAVARNAAKLVSHADQEFQLDIYEAP